MAAVVNIACHDSVQVMAATDNPDAFAERSLFGPAIDVPANTSVTNGKSVALEPGTVIARAHNIGPDLVYAWPVDDETAPIATGLGYPIAVGAAYPVPIPRGVTNLSIRVAGTSGTDD